MAKRKPDSHLATLDREVNERLSGTKYICVNGRILIDPNHPFEINLSPTPVSPTQYCESTQHSSASVDSVHTSACTCMSCYVRELDAACEEERMDAVKRDPFYIYV